MQPAHENQQQQQQKMVVNFIIKGDATHRVAIAYMEQATLLKLEKPTEFSGHLFVRNRVMYVLRYECIMHPNERHSL